MQKIKNKLSTVFVCLILVASMFAVLSTIEESEAHTPPWEIPTAAFMNITPNPVGVGQNVFIVFWLDRTPSGASVSNDIRMKGYELHITRPDGTTEKMVWDVIWDTTSSQFTEYTPTQIGDYTITFVYPGQVYTWDATAAQRTWTGDIFKPSNRTLTLTVQQEPVAPAITSYPLPTEYWTRPIEGQNTDWYTIASNWLGSGNPYLTGQRRKIQPDGIAPNSAHIMWTKPIQDGGVVGGPNVGIEGNTFYPGLTYQRRFGAQIIMYGRLFYQLPYGNSGSGGDYVAVDLRTGEELWRTNTTGIGVPSFGYYYSLDTPNQHGVLPQGLLFTSNFARAYDPTTGIVTTMNVTNVPSAGTAVLGPKGEHLRYVWDYNNRWMAQWNSSKVVGYESGMAAGGWFSGTINASTSNRYDWNVTLPNLPGSANPSMIIAKYEDLILGRSTTFVSSTAPSNFGTPDPYTFWAISLKPGQEGRLLWLKNYPAPPNNMTLLQGTVDFDARVFTMYVKDTMEWYGYSIDNGNQLWGPTPRPLSDFDYYEPDTTAVAAFGKFFYANYGGICYCYDGKTGELLWTYGNGGPGNSTYYGYGGAWGRTPIQPEVLADGKIYLTSTEHSPNTPLYKNSRLICLNITDGTELWSILNYGGTYGGFGPQAAIADGYLVTLNQYDYQIYCYGKGPSQLTVTAPDLAAGSGQSVVIKGTVIDIASGTTQNEQAARFPNGVPCVSDESMSAWMEYVYMQKPKPTEVKGVTVELFVIDANSNYRSIGEATTDANGFYSLQWTPDIPGKYTVHAKFAGTESYWPSQATTAFAVDEAPETTPSPTEAPPSTVEQYFWVAVAAIIIAIVVIGAILIMLMLRKKE